MFQRKHSRLREGKESKTIAGKVPTIYEVDKWSFLKFDELDKEQVDQRRRSFDLKKL